MRAGHAISRGLLVAAAVLGAGTTASAARLLTATVELDGRVVLRTHYADDARPPAGLVWRYLGREPGFAAVAAVPADPADPLRAALRGDVVVRVLHGERP